MAALLCCWEADFKHQLDIVMYPENDEVFVRTDLHDQNERAYQETWRRENKSQGTELDMYHLAYEHEGYLDGTS